MYSRRVSKEPIIKHPFEDFHVSDSSESGGSGLEDEVEVNPDQSDFVEDNSDSWDGKDDDDDVELGQMGAGAMNSNYESKEFHSLNEASSDDEIGYDSDDNFEDDTSTHGRGQKHEKMRKFPVFKPVAKARHLSFEKDMVFTTPKQFKEAITEYVAHGGWGIRFAKNDLLMVRAICQPNCKFIAYLTKVPRERSN